MYPNDLKKYYFSPTTPIESRDKEDISFEKQRQKSEAFCTVWQNAIKKEIEYEENKKASVLQVQEYGSMDWYV